MAAETGAGGAALIKWIGVPVIAGALASVVGFIFLPPHSHREFLHRLFVTFLGSFTIGPVFYFTFISHFPGTLDMAVRELSGVGGIEPAMVKLSLSAPFLIAGGLPGWWVLGWGFRWMEKRKNQDLGEVVREIKRDFTP